MYKKSEISIQKNRCKFTQTIGNTNHYNATEPKQYRNVKKIEVFIDNLDDQILSSYRKLKLSREKMNRIDGSDSRIQEKAFPSHKNGSKVSISTGKIRLSQKNDSHKQKNAFQTPVIRQKNIKSSVINEQFVLIPNEDVIQYINFIYEKYNLNDPLAENSFEKRSFSQTQKKLDESKRVQCYSALTMKKSDNDKIQIEPYFEEQSTCINLVSQDKKNIPIVSLKPQSHRLVNRNSKFVRSIKLKNKNEIDPKQQLSTAHTRKIKSQLSNFTDTQIKQLFRYCFMCEQQILESNLSHHEANCKQLKIAMQYSLEKIIQILDNKIQSLIHSIQNNFLHKQQAKIQYELTGIKERVAKWIIKLSQLQNIERMPLTERNKNTPTEWRGYFSQIEACVNKSFFNSFEAINKLNWFAKLRQNINFKHF